MEHMDDAPNIGESDGINGYRLISMHDNAKNREMKFCVSYNNVCYFN